MEIMVPIITSCIAAIGGILAAYYSSTAKARQEKADRDTKEYREHRERIDRAKWKVLLATMEGVTVLLHQAKGEKLNGNVESALNNIMKAKDELTNVQAEINSSFQ